MLTHQQGKKQAQSSLGPKPNCEWPPPGRAEVCWPCKVSKLKCMVGGVPQSMKRVKLAPPDKVGPSKGPLFLDSEPEEESVSETSEALPAGLAELEGAI